MKLTVLILIFFLSFNIYAQDVEAARRATIQFGTETEIAALIQALRNEKAEYLDAELVALIANTRNQRILSGVFGFFGEREKADLEERALRALDERYDESNETVISAIDYLGRIKSSQAVSLIKDILDTEERRFLSVGFRALGRASSADSALADETAEYLVDYYEFRNPGNDYQREVVAAIGATGSSKGVPFLSDMAMNTDERIPLRVAALEALALIGDEEGVEAVLFCVSTNDPNVRTAAVSALGPFSGDAVDSAILDAFRDSYYRTRIAAAQASRDRKLAAAVPYLQYRAERDEVVNVKDEAIRALGAIANDEAITVLESLFYERRNSDRVRLIAGEMLMKNKPDDNLSRYILELDEAQRRNQTALYNGLLRVIGETVVSGDKTDMENITRRFLRSGTIIEKSYGLDMAVNNRLVVLSEEIKTLAADRNESLARKAQRTADTLGIEI